MSAPAPATTLPGRGAGHEVAVALFNYQDGGLRGHTYDFAPLKRAFADPTTSLDLVLLCEAKRFGERGNAGLLGAAATLSEQLDRPFVGVLGWCERGPHGPAIFYDPNVLQLRYWWDKHARPDDEADDKVNLARFRVRSSGVEFLALAQHWSFRSGDRRLEEARLIGRYGELHHEPVLVGGDFNSVPSGPHWRAQGEWAAQCHTKKTQKGTQHPDQRWGLDTRALDHLLGEWDQHADARADGCGFASVAELAAASGTPPALAYLPTVNTDVDAGSGLPIDQYLVNQHMARRYVPGTFQVHVPPAGQAPPSDHRLVTATFNLAGA